MADDLTFKYLEIRNLEYQDLTSFLSLHEDMIVVAEEIEEKIYKLAKTLHHKYIEIYVNNNNIKCSKEERSILKEIHKLYIETRQRTIPSRINDILSRIHPKKLDSLLKTTDYQN